MADRRRRAVPGVDTGIVAEREQYVPDGRDERGVISARQVRPSDGSCKQRISDEQMLVGLAFTPHLQADSARTVAWRVMRAHFASAERNDLAGRIELVHRGRRIHL